MTQKILAVIGPTASGKSSIGLSLAEHVGGEIVSADSMQIYRQMDIGTAKPSLADRRQVRHHLIDILNPDQPYNAGQFSSDADQAIAEIGQQSQVPIIVGGTHLYLKTLIHGLIAAPEVKPELQKELYVRLENEGVGALHRQLSQLDPEAAKKLHPNDSSRVTRALAVYLSTGRSIIDWQESHQFQELRYQPYYLAIRWEREQLYQRINQRVELMVEQGLVSETQALLDQGYSPELPALSSIGYKQAVSRIAGDIDQDQMIQQIQQASRRYAKKQLTWVRSISPVHWLEPGQVDLAHLTTFLA